MTSGADDERRPRPRGRWRDLLRRWHRDVGYLAAGLTVAYAASGIAVNHIESWNPRYAIDTVAVDIGALPGGVDDDGVLMRWEAAVRERLGIGASDIRGRHASGPREFKVFLREGGEVRVDPRDGKGIHKRVSPRRPLYEAHVLHLNQLKGAWTWVADGFALALLFLTLSGLAFPRGRQGLLGRGGVFAAVGALIPLVAIAAFYWGGA
jgi:hypothetical protein